jgi:hypothetical protein
VGGAGSRFVRAIAVLGANVYAAGDFTTAGGLPVNRIAKWNGSSWSGLGNGLSGPGFPAVNALAVEGTNLYVGGVFATAGGSSANNIARWNGTAWSPLGSGLNGEVYAIAVNGNDIYAGGTFSTVGAFGVAKWNGSTWSGIGTGIAGGSPQVDAIALNGSDLYLGGSFTFAGGIPSEGFAHWSVPGTRPRLSSLVRLSSSQVQFNVIGWTGLNYTIQYSTTLTNWSSLLTTNASTNTFRVTDTSATNVFRSYRALAQ